VNLPAALQSPWFAPHVVVYFFGYSALGFAFLSAILHLWRPGASVHLLSKGGERLAMTWAGFMHRAILFGFIMLTAGLVLGAIWAHAAWGTYWAWDPKENWALVSWLCFAIYLHLRKAGHFDERAGAWLTIAGFAAVLFTYLGMHLLPSAAQSAHVYQ
jgi:ABC-type transport system involved in cytochrome c biogenesis permease subunit